MQITIKISRQITRDKPVKNEKAKNYLTKELYVKALKYLLYGILFIQLIWFSACTKTTLPDPIYAEHNNNTLVTVSWFNKHTPLYYKYKTLRADGSITYKFRCSAIMGCRAGAYFQPTQQQLSQIENLLNSLDNQTFQESYSGEIVITLSYSWQGQNHIRSFNETNCPSDLSQLLDVMNKAQSLSGKEFHEQPCKELPIKPTASNNISSSTTILPNHIQMLHSLTLFQINWFTEPFTESYKGLYLEENLYGSTLVYYDEPERTQQITASITDEERQEIQNLLTALTEPGVENASQNDTTIVLGFPWEIDYHLLTFDTESCPDELQQLLEMSEDILEHAAPGWEAFDNPCQEE